MGIGDHHALGIDQEAGAIHIHRHIDIGVMRSVRFIIYVLDLLIEVIGFDLNLVYFIRQLDNFRVFGCGRNCIYQHRKGDSSNTCDGSGDGYHFLVFLPQLYYAAALRRLDIDGTLFGQAVVYVVQRMTEILPLSVAVHLLEKKGVFHDKLIHFAVGLAKVFEMKSFVR